MDKELANFLEFRIAIIIRMPANMTKLITILLNYSSRHFKISGMSSSYLHLPHTTNKSIYPSIRPSIHQAKQNQNHPQRPQSNPTLAQPKNLKVMHKALPAFRPHSSLLNPMRSHPSIPDIQHSLQPSHLSMLIKLQETNIFHHHQLLLLIQLGCVGGCGVEVVSG